jgi:hypothetical protein
MSRKLVSLSKIVCPKNPLDARDDLSGNESFGQFIGTGNSLDYSSTPNNNQMDQSKLDSEKEEGPYSGNQGKDWEIIVSPSKQVLKKE